MKLVWMRPWSRCWLERIGWATSLPLAVLELADVLQAPSGRALMQIQ